MKSQQRRAPTVEHTSLWERTLAPIEDGQPLVEQEKGRLREAFFSFRDRAAELVSHIARELPEFTVHDVTHLDALWEMADVVVGQDYFLSPAEGFIFGGAVLLHDSAMSLSAYPEGLGGLKRSPEWSDTVVAEFRSRGLAEPTAEERENPPESILPSVLSALLRSNHAQQAEILATKGWKRRDDAPFFLIEDPEARMDLGQLIGRIAHSHWWDLDKVEREFHREMNPPVWCRHAGQIRPLVIACLLRCADAIHLDARRAPRFRRALVRPAGESADHWSFQERLMPPTRKEDAVYFTGGPFKRDHYASWWLCYDTLKVADSELANTHALLSDHKAPTFAASRVHSIDNLDRLSQLITTSGWTPVDTSLRASNLQQIVLELGGNALYRKKRWAIVRELIQNAADAIRARRAIEGRSPTWGTIEISIVEDEKTDLVTLRVRDTGIGMTDFVIRNYLLDFFKSYWSSPDAAKQFKGHLHSFRPTGKYGVGFYSVFTVAKRVRIKTRSCLDSTNNTRVLSFVNGLRERPLLRTAEGGECLVDPGTIVEIDIASRKLAESILRSANVQSWAHLIEFVAPALDVQITYSSSDESRIVIEANDWIRIPAEDLLCRINPSAREYFAVSPFNSVPQKEIDEIEHARFQARCLTEVFDIDRRQIGRWNIDVDFMIDDEQRNCVRPVSNPDMGAMVCGGLRIDSVKEFVGLIEGDVEDASRNLGYVNIEILRGGSLFRCMEDSVCAALRDVDRKVFSEKTIDSAAIHSAQFLTYLGASVHGLWVAWHQKKGYLRVEDLAFLKAESALYMIEHEPKRKVLKRLNKKQMEAALKKNPFDRNEAFDWLTVATPDNVLVIPNMQNRSSDIYYVGEYNRIVTERPSQSSMIDTFRLIVMDRAEEEKFLEGGRLSYHTAGVALVGLAINRLWGGNEECLKSSVEHNKRCEVPTAPDGDSFVTDAWIMKKLP